MQYLTNSYLKATPHKVGLNTRERFAFAYFHEPNFSSTLKPLSGDGASEDVGVHYGSHFTSMFMRNCPDRITTKRIIKEDRLAKLSAPELRLQ